MKFDVVHKEAQSHGDIKHTGVSIDTSNLDFLITILSTNLYSRPIESFIRETVSNAWDSHVEAGVTEPVVLELGKDTEGNYFCRVQDFGVGLSPERFDAIYKNIGSSTKRGSNAQIGGFGIGRFAALAYTDMVHITSVFDKKKYIYVMYKDGNSISIDMVYELDTDERNGVEVRVDLKSSGEVPSFYEAIKRQLVYFENLYFVDSTDRNSGRWEKEFNEFVIKRYDNFLVNNLDPDSKRMDILLGKVRYPLRIDALTKTYTNEIAGYPISLKLEIGDLEVTPNREEVLYSTKNVTKIEEVLDKAIEEIAELVRINSDRDFTSLSDYVRILREPSRTPLLVVGDITHVAVRTNEAKTKITLNGVQYPKDKFLKIHDAILDLAIIPVAYELDYNNKLWFYNSHTSIKALKLNFDKFYICDITSLSNMAKTYVRENMQSGDRFVHSNKSIKFFIRKIYKDLHKNLRSYYNGSTNFDSASAKIILKTLFKNLNNIKKFDESGVPKSFIDKKKQEAKDKRALHKNAGIDWSQNVNISVVRDSNNSSYYQTVDTEAHKLSDARKKFRKLTVYSDKDNERLRSFFRLLTGNNRVNFIEVAPTRHKLIKDFPNFVHIDNFMDVKYKAIRQIGTAMLILEKVPHLNEFYRLDGYPLKDISIQLHDTVCALQNYVNSYYRPKQDADKALLKEIFELCKDKNYFDEDIRGLLDANLELLTNAKAILMFVENNYGYKLPKEKINLVIDYVLARRLFRPDLAAAKKCKEESIFNIKPVKVEEITDESNQN